MGVVKAPKRQLGNRFLGASINRKSVIKVWYRVPNWGWVPYFSNISSLEVGIRYQIGVVGVSTLFYVKMRVGQHWLQYVGIDPPPCSF